MSKIFVFAFISAILTSCFVSKKQYLALEQELNEIKATLLDEDKDGVPNYLDLEAKSADSAHVDTKGRTIVVEKIVDMDQDGILDIDDFCPTIKGQSASNGCPDRDGDGIYDFVDVCPDAAGLKQDNGCPVVKPIICVGRPDLPVSPVNFVPKTVKLDAKTNARMDSIVKAIAGTMKVNPTYLLEIKGFTDNVGDSLKNKTLSEKRADLIKKMLIKQGIAEERLTSLGFGEENPIDTNETKKGRAANNRVEFVIKLKE